MTRISNATLVRVLKKARAGIENHYYNYVCNALRSRSEQTMGDLGAADALANFISECMTPHHTAESWLDAQPGMVGWNWENYSRGMRQWRLDWIDAMIEDAKAGRIKLYLEVRDDQDQSQ